MQPCDGIFKMTSGINSPYATTTIKSGLRLTKSFEVSSFLRLNYPLIGEIDEGKALIFFQT